MINPLVLPFPPSSNTYYRSIRMGQSCRVLISKRGREYKQEVVDLIASMTEQDAGLRALGRTFPISSRVGMSVMLHAPNRRRYDLDNRAKALCDALEGAGIFAVGDEQIDALTLRRGEIIKGGRAVVHLYELPDRSVAST